MKSLCIKKSANRTKKGRILLEKFDFFINLLRKPLGSSNEKKNSPAYVNMEK